MEEVAVNGIRASLNRSRQKKRQSPIISDVIVARDIASYPDSNLAESLQRIPGMSITREAGEGRQIMLRGLNPDFTLVTLNGMPVLANNDSPMDSRLQKHRDRSFDLNLFATELFSEIQVLKSYMVDQPSGGLAGIAALQTAHPFNTPGLHWSVTQQVGTNQYAGSLASRLSGMLSSTRGNWGALLSVSYGSRESQEVGANTFRWRKISPEGAEISTLTSDLQQAWRAQQLWIPRGNRYSVWHSDMRRLGIGASLEYLNNHSHITFDWLYGEFSGERQENHLYPRGLNSTPVIEGQTNVTEAQVNQQNELIYARYQNARVGNESHYQKVATHYQQWVVNTEHHFNSSLSGSGTFGIEQASYNMPLSIKAYMRGSSDITIDYRDDYHFADITYADDLTAPSLWEMNELDSELVQDQLVALGFEFMDDRDEADVVLFNTCSVREQAENKVLSRVGELGIEKNNGRDVVVGMLGCLPEREGARILSKYPQVNFICGPSELDKLPTLLNNAIAGIAAKFCEG